MKYLFESFFGKVRTLNKVEVFGCQVYAYSHKVSRKSKLHDHAKAGINMGMNSGQYRVVRSKAR